MRTLGLTQFKKRSLGLTWLLLGIYAWLSTAVQFSHTDDLRAILSQTAAVVAASAPPVHHALAPVAPAGIRRAVHDAPAGPCAACEWEAAVHTASVPTFALAHLPVAYDLVRAEQFESALLQRGKCTPTLRGPPAAA